MTDLKKETEDFTGEMCEDGNLKVNPDEFYKFIKNIEEQALLSQKQDILKLLDKCFTRNDINELIDKLEKELK